ncbi:O-antigen ligase [Neptuniibacter sp. 2_MG-2023]|uniref:O-antigen ligase family protein n=1 Tax=Neptuniibacter sp. 2_MG-2023 TaxID=3062671 RepID=UPI0026E34545|nr:O-antigen ligase family protein [Neptuniibacter sp. 2_MG-2023]MDO6512886.1 O-antigen ligase family protein [Neptuniibacter sp. 2_MG-2023]
MVISISYYKIFVFSVLFLIFNVKVLTGLDFSNAIEKMFFLLACFYLWWFGRLNKWAMVSCLLVVIICLFSAFMSKNENLDYWILFKALTQIVILFFLLGAVVEERESLKLAKFFCFVPLICILLGCVYTGVGIRNLISIEYVSGLPRLQGTLIPAYLGGLSITAVFCSLYLVQKSGYTYFWLVAFNALVLFLTGGRMALFVGASLCMLYFYFSFKSQSHLKVFLTLLGIGGCFILLLFGGGLFSRITQTHLSGRDLIWNYLLDLINEYEWFGVGFGHQIYFVPDEVKILTGNTIGAHNEYLRISSEIGVIPAFFAFLIMFSFCFYRAFYSRGIGRLMMFAGTFLYALFCYTDNALSSPHIFIFIVVLFNIYSGSGGDFNSKKGKL